MRTPPRRRAPPNSRLRDTPKRQLRPSQFKVNECWLVVKASALPLLVGEELLDVYVLQDAATMYLFGNVFVSVATQGVPETEVSSLFENAWGAKREWPQRLLLPSSIEPDSPFFAVAKRNNIAVEVVPESALAIYSKDVQTAFRDHFGRDGTGVA